MELFDSKAYNQLKPGLSDDILKVGKAVKFITGTTSTIYEPASEKNGFTTPECDTEGSVRNLTLNDWNHRFAWIMGSC